MDCGWGRGRGSKENNGKTEKGAKQSSSQAAKKGETPKKVWGIGGIEMHNHFLIIIQRIKGSSVKNKKM